jgi:hypothetical protein
MNLLSYPIALYPVLLPPINEKPTLESPLVYSVRDLRSHEFPTQVNLQSSQQPLAPRISAVPPTRQQIQTRIQQLSKPFGWLTPISEEPETEEQQAKRSLEDIQAQPVQKKRPKVVHKWTENDRRKLIQGLLIEKLSAREVQEKYFPDCPDITIKKINSRFNRLTKEQRDRYLSQIENIQKQKQNEPNSSSAIASEGEISR